MERMVFKFSCEGEREEKGGRICGRVEGEGEVGEWRGKERWESGGGERGGKVEEIRISGR